LHQADTIKLEKLAKYKIDITHEHVHDSHRVLEICARVDTSCQKQYQRQFVPFYVCQILWRTWSQINV